MRFVLQLVELDGRRAIPEAHAFLNEKPTVLIFPWKAVTDDDYGVGIAKSLDHHFPLPCDRIEDSDRVTNTLNFPDQFTFDRNCTKE